MKALLSEQQVRAGVERMAAEVNRQYGDRPLTIIGVMTGSVVLLADLIRQLAMPLRVGVIQASSYRGGTEAGELRINTDFVLDVADRDVLLVDDIFDTGRTLEKVVQLIQSYGPRSVRSAVLLRKLGRQEVESKPDFVGFDIPDLFVVGYGLDYRDHYRNLPYVAAIEPEDLVDESGEL